MTATIYAMLIAQEGVAHDAQDAPAWCSAVQVTDSGPLDGVKLASAGHVTPGARLRLRSMPEQDCDAAPGACARAVPPGTRGVLLHRRGPWACVVLPGPGRIDTRAGWIPGSRWSEDRAERPAPWTSAVGTWQNEHAKITVTRGSTGLRIVGHAIWQGPRDPRFGEFDVDANPEGDLVSLVGPCEVHIRRLGAHLFAQDNHQCGGINVSFDGLYRFRPGVAKVAGGPVNQPAAPGVSPRPWGTGAPP